MCAKSKESFPRWVPANSGATELITRVWGAPSQAQGLAAARALLAHFGSLHQLLRADQQELMRVGNIGERRATRLAAALELGRRASEERATDELSRRALTSIEDVDAWARPRLAHLMHEEVWLLSIDARGRLQRADRVAQGGVRSCSLLPLDVLRPAVRNGACGAVLVHNHPSGDATPSTDDVEMTRKLTVAFKSVGICLLDHVVIGATCSTSIADLGGIDDRAA